MQDRTLERRASDWVIDRIGPDHMHPRERAMRLLEEALELAQAEGITDEQVERQSAHVFARFPGKPEQEAGGVAVCLLAWCAIRQTTFDKIARAELDRIEAKAAAEIRGSLARKEDADLVTALENDDHQFVKWLRRVAPETMRVWETTYAREQIKQVAHSTCEPPPNPAE